MPYKGPLDQDFHKLLGSVDVAATWWFFKYPGVL